MSSDQPDGFEPIGCSPEPLRLLEKRPQLFPAIAHPPASGRARSKGSHELCGLIRLLGLAAPGSSVLPPVAGLASVHGCRPAGIEKETVSQFVSRLERIRLVV